MVIGGCEFAGQNVGAGDGEAGAHAAGGRRTVGGVADQGYPSTGPGRQAGLAEGVEVQRCVIERGEHARRLPAGVRERTAQDRDHGVAVEILESTNVGQERQGGAGGADVVRSQRDAATAAGVVPAPPVGVGVGSRDRQIGGVEAEFAHCVAAGEHQ